MNNNKGQALVEFVMLLPILLIIIMYIVDSSKIAIQKNEIENNINVVTNLYSNKNIEELNNYIKENNLEINYIKQDNLTTITIKKDTNFTMPLLKKILGNKIETKRTIYEQNNDETEETDETDQVEQ